MASSQEIKLGRIITEPAERDAVHIAIVPAIAAHRLHPNSDVKLELIQGEIYAEAESEILGVSVSPHSQEVETRLGLPRSPIGPRTES